MAARKFLFLISILVVVSSTVVPNQASQAAPLVSTGDCRFGITVANWSFMAQYVPNESVARYDLPLVGVGYYLDWWWQRNASVPAFIRYTHVLSVRDDVFPTTLAELPTLVANYPGAIWIVGNEPDSPQDQDNVTAETYADRFYAYATYIHAHDPTALVSFGTITQPTPLRLRYLDYAWARLQQDAGGKAQASALVDIWTPHGFILNESPTQWGAHIPPAKDAAVYNEYLSLATTIVGTDIYNFDMFKQRIAAFRDWMNKNGERNKPMWLTEFGNLLPPYNSNPNNMTAPDPITPNFMKQTFDWLYSTKNTSLGLPSDGNRLVQKWFWYSLNDLVFHFGGTLIDPLTLQPTSTGNTFMNYDPPVDASVVVPAPAITPLSLQVIPVKRNANNHTLVDYLLKARIRNNVISDFLTKNVIVKVFDGNTLLSNTSVTVERCGGDAIVNVSYNGVQPGGAHTFRIEVIPQSGTGGSSNFPVDPLPVPFETMIPVIKN